MTPEEFRHLYTIHVLKKKPLFLYRVGGTISINVVTSYDVESDFVHYIQISEYDRSMASSITTDAPVSRERVFKVSGEVLSMDLSNYSKIIFEYEPKVYSFRWVNDFEFLRDNVTYAEISRTGRR